MVVKIALLPLGTGNDLSGYLGWGVGYTGGDLNDYLFQLHNTEVCRHMTHTPHNTHTRRTQHDTTRHDTH